jgi:hypothetical protein
VREVAGAHVRRADEEIVDRARNLAREHEANREGHELDDREQAADQGERALR